MRRAIAVVLFAVSHASLIGCGSSDGGSSNGGSTPGEAELIASAVFPLSLALDGDTIWFTDYSAGTISRIDKSGGTVEVIAEQQIGAWDIAVDATHVYWTRASNSNTAPEANSVSRVVKQGGTVEVLAGQLSEARRIALDDQYLYFSALQGDGVYRLSKSGGLPEQVGAGDTVHDVVVVGSQVCWTAVTTPGEVACAHVAGGPETKTVLAAPDRPRGLASDGSVLYYTMDEAVGSVSMGGGAQTTLASDKHAIPSVAVDSGAVFWVTQGYGKSGVFAVSVAGGTPHTLAIAGVPSPTTVRADATHVYWVDNQGGTDGRLMRVAR